MPDRESITTDEDRNSLSPAQRDMRYLYWGTGGDASPSSSRVFALEDCITDALLKAALAAYQIDDPRYEELIRPIQSRRASFEQKVLDNVTSLETPLYVTVFRQCQHVLDRYCAEVAAQTDGDAAGQRLMGIATAEADFYVIQEEGDVPDDTEIRYDPYSASFPFDPLLDGANRQEYQRPHP